MAKVETLLRASSVNWGNNGVKGNPTREVRQADGATIRVHPQIPWGSDSDFYSQ